MILQEKNQEGIEAGNKRRAFSQVKMNRVIYCVVREIARHEIQRHKERGKSSKREDGRKEGTRFPKIGQVALRGALLLSSVCTAGNGSSGCSSSSFLESGR